MLTSRSGNTSDSAELLDYIPQHSREEPGPLSHPRVRRTSRFPHLRPESNTESTKGEGFAFLPSGSRMLPNTQSTVLRSPTSPAEQIVLRFPGAEVLQSQKASGLQIPESSVGLSFPPTLNFSFE